MAASNKFIFTTPVIEEVLQKSNDGYVLHRYENPWLSGESGVRRSALTFHMTSAERLEYAKCKLNIHYFSRKHCKIKLTDGSIGHMSFKGREYQKRILDLIVNNRFSILMASRQVGKTVSTAIAILHYIIFNNDKNVMIMANKLTTSVEILDKIKSIYKHLPFFLKPGVSSWQSRTIVFRDTGCRIMTSARTKEPAIGFSIDFLYLDEFAHIPKNIINSFYRSAYPTVSGIENSKIVISSTPSGRNLFWSILDAAERPDDDPKKNNFKPMRVYWWQVPGRNMTYIRLNQSKLDEFEITKEEVLYYLQTKHELVDNCKLKYSDENFRWEIHIKNSQDLKNEDIRRWTIKADEFEGIFENIAEPVEININNIAQVTSWKEETIKDIGSEEAFNQEYGLQFYAASNLTFDEDVLAQISGQEENYVWHEIDEFERQSHLNYDNLKWIEDRPDIFEWTNKKNYYYAVGIDLSEGLGQDFSVINIFRVMTRPIEEMEKYRVESVYDFFKLEQVGMYRHNLTSIKQMSEILYVLFFHVLNENKIKVCLEYNTYGAEILAYLPNLYQGNNNYSSHVFARYKHRADATFGKIGLKVKSNKGMLVKEYQHRINNNFVVIHESNTIREVTTFVKVENPRSNVEKFEAESGNDDCVMSVIGISTLFQNTGYKDLIDYFIDNELDSTYTKFIETRLDGIEYPTGVDYSILWSAKKKLADKKIEYEHAIVKNHELSRGGMI